MDATFAQAAQFLNLINQQHASFEQLQALFDSGILRDLLQADPQVLRSVRPQIRSTLELDRQLEKILIDVGWETFEHLVAQGKYDYVNRDITPERFRFHMTSGLTKRVVYMMRFNESKSTAEVIAEMREAHKKPCDFEEFLTLGARHRYLQNRRSIVFLDDNYADEHAGEPLLYACLFGSGDQRRLGLGLEDNKWGPTYQFACVDA